MPSRGPGLLSREHPPLLQDGLRIGADWVDMDVVLTKENES